jgi:murein DD-endopeptidase MepM/ murein hydrolase activator NlpD
MFGEPLDNPAATSWENPVGDRSWKVLVSPQHVPDRAGKTSDRATPNEAGPSTAHPTGQHRLVRRKPSRRAKLIGLTAALAAAAGSGAVGLHYNAGPSTAPTTVALSAASTDLGSITTARIERQELTTRGASRLDLSLDSTRKLAVSTTRQADARAAKAAADETLTKRRALALTAARKAAAEKVAAHKAAAAKVAAEKAAAAKAAAKAAAEKAAADRKAAAEHAAAKAAADRKAAAHEAAVAREAAAHRAAVRAAEHQAAVKAESREASVKAAPNAQHQASARKASARTRIVLPVARYHLTARFNQGRSRWAHRHTGLDFAAPIGTPIRSVMAGVVTQARFAGAYGRQVKVRHYDGTVTSYGHMSRFSVSVGRVVAAGSQVGAVGVTGNTTGPHVHFEVRPGGGAPIDPAPWLRRHGLRP